MATTGAQLLHLRALVDAAFALASLVQQRLQLPAVVGGVDVRLALAGTGAALAAALPLWLLGRLLTSEALRSVPSLDVQLTAEEAAENADRKWARARVRRERAAGSCPAHPDQAAPARPTVRGHALL